MVARRREVRKTTRNRRSDLRRAPGNRHVAPLLVTGAAGFIGSYVSLELLARGHRVVGVDNLNDAYDVRLKEWRLAQLDDKPGFDFWRLDIEDRQAVMQLVQGVGPQAILNFAARAGVRQSVRDPWGYFGTNVGGVLNLLEACRVCGVPKFLLASTSSIYGNRNPLPFREDADTDHPLSPYAASKKGAELLCHSYHHLHGLDIVIARLFTVYGPAGRPDMSLFRFVHWVSEGLPVIIYGDGEQSRDFTYVEDVAQACVLALHLDGYQVVNVGGDQPVRLLEALQLVEELVGKRAKVEHQAAAPGDMPASWADIGRARELLDWEPRTTLQEGIGRLVDWYRANRDWARNIAT